MEPTDYEYRGLMAQTWDLFRGDTSNWPDRAFYRNLILRYGQPALDVGCATGRLLLDYLAQGIDIDGVDLSPEMLALCRAKAQQQGLTPRLYQQAMELLDLPRIYRTIIVPSSSFQLIIDPVLAAQAMQRLFGHLESGGVLIMPFMLLWQPGEPTATDWSQSGEATRPEDGTVARRWSRADYDPAAQIEDTEDRYEIMRDGVVVRTEEHRRSPATRWYTQEQAIQLYRDAGFTKLTLCKGFSDEAASAEDRLFSVLGVKP
jgi:SAM-dependent methyltransferase